MTRANLHMYMCSNPSVIPFDKWYSNPGFLVVFPSADEMDCSTCDESCISNLQKNSYSMSHYNDRTENTLWLLGILSRQPADGRLNANKHTWISWHIPYAIETNSLGTWKCKYTLCYSLHARFKRPERCVGFHLHLVQNISCPHFRTSYWQTAMKSYLCCFFKIFRSNLWLTPHQIQGLRYNSRVGSHFFMDHFHFVHVHYG